MGKANENLLLLFGVGATMTILYYTLVQMSKEAKEEKV
jgi:hypothetical protein